MSGRVERKWGECFSRGIAKKRKVPISVSDPYFQVCFLIKMLEIVKLKILNYGFICSS